MENKQEIIRIIKKYRDTEYLDTAADEILRLFSVVGRSEQLPPNPITDKEHKELMKALYPKDNSKRFRR